MPRQLRSRDLAFLGALIAAAACGGGGSGTDDGPTGDLQVTAQTTGTDLDPDGYGLSVDGGTSVSIAANGTRGFPGLGTGAHSVSITGIAANCSLVGPTPRSVSITKDQQTDLSVEVTCITPPPLPGSIALTIATSGLTPDLDGYQYSVDGGAGVAVGRNVTQTIGQLAPGAHTVTLSGIAANCSVSGSNPVTVTVTSGSAVPVAFSLTCAANLKNRIVFASSRGTTGTFNEVELWSVNPDGSDPFRITVNTVFDGSPSVSPDGFRLVYGSGAFGLESQLWVANADGSNPVQITTGTSAGLPEWSPDGTRIVFSRQVGTSGFLDLVLIDPDGGNLVTVGSTDPGRTTRRFSPTWSPDGSRIAFGTDSSLNSIAVNGTDEVEIYHGPISHVNWSRQGNRLVFNAPAVDPGQPGTFGTGVWVVQPNGQNLSQALTTVANVNHNSPSWNPDGTRLVFSRIQQPSGDLNIWVMNPDGSGQAEVASPGDLNLTPTWR